LIFTVGCWANRAMPVSYHPDVDFVSQEVV
jgi:hypothetical protein